MRHRQIIRSETRIRMCLRLRFVTVPSNGAICIASTRVNALTRRTFFVGLSRVSAGECPGELSYYASRDCHARVAFTFYFPRPILRAWGGTRKRRDIGAVSHRDNCETYLNAFTMTTKLRRVANNAPRNRLGCISRRVIACARALR